jgi:hypothetical protein
MPWKASDGNCSQVPGDPGELIFRQRLAPLMGRLSEFLSKIHSIPEPENMDSPYFHSVGSKKNHTQTIRDQFWARDSMI